MVRILNDSGLLDNLTFPKIFILSDQYRKPTHLLLRWQHGQQLLDALPVDDGGVHLHDGRPDDPRGRELCHADVDGVGPLVVQHDYLPGVRAFLECSPIIAISTT